MVQLVKHDLEYILKQIKIAEQHAAGTPMSELIDSPLLPYGLRTVDGSYNNLVPGREQWGASDEPFRSVNPPNWRNEGDDEFPYVPGNNNDYGAPGSVADADPRLISNLIVDQTSNNPIATMLYERYLAEGKNVSATPLLNQDGTPKLANDGSPLLSYTFDNISPDIGDSAPYSSVFTLFGQFFDHGLDLVAKGGNGTIYMPLSPDDPLYDPASPHTNFMVLTRAALGEAAKNTTTAWVDQNQTYGSHASKQVFMREYEIGPDGRPVATGLLLEGAGGGLATWADVKHQAKTLLGIELTDKDVGRIPLIAADQYGNFIPGPNGYAQLVLGFGADGILGTDDDVLVEGNPAAPINPSTVVNPENGAKGAIRTDHAFLDDIAHNAVPVIDPAGNLVPDTDGTIGSSMGRNTEYDADMLDAHFITGDGRGNENIGLTAIHHVFHGEHNLIVEQTKDVVLQSGDLAFLNEWLLVDLPAGTPIPAKGSAGYEEFVGSLKWDGERLFQSGRFVTEMEYQHLVFEEFARKMQPDVDLFLFEPDPDINPAIFAEFANVVYRFGHSMLNETVDRVDADGNSVGMTLFDAFLNPLAYDNSGALTHDQAAGAVLRGMSAQVGNEIDEFVTNVLRNQLTGIPLDLAAINIARGRDTGMPTLNEARAQFRAMAGGDSQLDPYTSWTDFALNLKNPESIINFIAAYGTHATITAETTIEGRRDAAMKIVLGGEGAPADRLAFLNATGAYAADGKLGGLQDVDLWVGGIAEKKMDFGGMLGSTFSFVFELQMENLQDGDRFYYLSRVQGLNLLSELESNSLAKMMLRNTDLGAEGTAIPGDIFSRPDLVLYANYDKQLLMTGQEDPEHDNPVLEAISNRVERRDGDTPTGLTVSGLPDGVTFDAATRSFLGTPTQAGTFLVTVVATYASSASASHTFKLVVASADPVSAEQMDVLVDDEWYNQQYGDVAAAGMDPDTHYVNFGWQEGWRDPNAFFDTDWYLAQNPDVAASGVNPLEHFLSIGWKQGRDPSPTFDVEKYLAAHPDVANEGMNPLFHYIKWGQAEGRAIFAAEPRDGMALTLGTAATWTLPTDLFVGDGISEYLRYNGGDHVVLQGSDGNDTLIGGDGDDSLWGEDGDDRLDGGYGVDHVHGGDGDDIITNAGTDIGAADFLHGDAGNDVIHGGSGLSLIFGNSGSDFIVAGPDGKTVMGGTENDYILGGDGMDFIMGEAGDDWLEGGGRFDTLAGENSELFFNSTIIGHDILNGSNGDVDYDAESGDDIMFQGVGIQRNNGMAGFDWAIHKGDAVAANSDLGIGIFQNQEEFILRDRFDLVEGLSGWKHNDILTGRSVAQGARDEIVGGAAIPAPDSPFYSWSNALTEQGVARIDGLRELLGHKTWDRTNPDAIVMETGDGSDILLGGDGSDTFEGKGGDDVIDGDAWLNVRIRFVKDGVAYTTDGLTTKVYREADYVNGEPVAGAVAQFGGRALTDLTFTREINPGILENVREILYADGSNDTDTAVYAGSMSWYEITHVGDKVFVARREDENIDPRIDEGADVLINIERIQFQDGVYVIRDTGNIDPTGRLQIIGMPAIEGQPLKVSAANVRDENNPGGIVTGITYRWQVERNDGTGDYEDIDGVNGDTFTPASEHTGLRIRVIGTYIDAGGVPETVYSSPTEGVVGVNNEPEGPLLISDMTPTEGQVLTSTVAFTDPDGITDAFEESLMTYRWQVASTPDAPDSAWTTVSESATDRTFKPGPADVGKYIRAVVDYTDDLGNNHRVLSAVTAIVGNRISTNAATVNGTIGDAQGGTTAGDDIVIGGNGGNNLSGGAGGDSIDGGAGNDRLHGEDGNDTLIGGTGNDTIDAGADNDTVIYRSGDGSDAIDGGAGTDTLRIVESTLGANDTARVVMANGLITGVGGAAVLATVTNVENMQLDLGAGVDTLDYNGTTDTVAVNLLIGTATGFDFVRGVENVTGGVNNDTLLGNNADNALDGAAGNDTIRGGFGNDALSGGIGNDQLYGEHGDDALNGGAGDDRIDGGVGTDTASYVGAAQGVNVSLATTQPQNTGGAGTDTLIGIENLTGSSQADTLIGSAGDNVLDGGAGADRMVGGAGNDTYVVDNGGDVVVEEAAGGGIDTVRSSLASYTLAANVENLILVGNASSGTGNALDNRLTGNAGNDTLNGGAGTDTVVLDGALADYTFGLNAQGNVTVSSAAGGSDTLISIERAEIGGITYNIVPGTNGADGNLSGGTEDDLVLGFNGNDTVNGGAGNDILKGGEGNDQLNGGAGNDILDGGTSGGGGGSVTISDNFNTSTLNGGTGWASNWVEIGDNSGINSASQGQIRIDSGNPTNALVFRDDDNDPGNGTASIQRTINLAGRTSATVSYTYQESSFDNGETVTVEFSPNGSAPWQVIDVINSSSNSGSINNFVLNGPFTATATIRFTVSGTNNNSGTNNPDYVAIDNLTITGITAGGDTMAGGDGDDTYYVDGISGTNVDQVIEGAGAGSGTDTIILTAAGSYTLANNVENLVVQGGGSRTLTGNAADNQITGGTGNDSIVGGVGNDTLKGGAGNDTLNGGAGSDVAVFDGSAGNYEIGINGAGLITVADRVGNGGTDTLNGIERVQFGNGEILQIVTGGGTPTMGPGLILGTAGDDVITGGNGGDVIIGGAGNDTLYGHDVGDGDAPVAGAPDDDTFIWRVGDGSDVINGGTEGANGDTLVIIGNQQSETYRIYTYDEAVARIAYAGSDENEIVVTRQVAGQPETIIAEITEIEEIVVNGTNVGGNGQVGNDRFEIFGNFETVTSLRPNTITLIGSDGDDIVDISALQSAHRIVFKSLGGNDTIVGTLRPQDVIELPDGTVASDYAVTTGEDGVTTMTNGTHTVRFVSEGGMPQVGPGDDEDEDEDDDTSAPGNGDDDEDDSCGHDDDDEDAGTGDNGGGTTPPATQPGTSVGAPIAGTNGTEVLVGTVAGETIMALDGHDNVVAGDGADVVHGGAGNDFLSGEAGRDMMFGGDGDDVMLGGGDADMLYGDAGNDRIFGDGGNDLIDAGMGSDTVYGGAGDDRIVASVNDGNDVVYGDDMMGGTGNDTLDMSAITANITANLGTNGGSGSVFSTQSGADTIWSIENIVTGSGNDTITANHAVNVIDGGAGNDVFRFLSAADANGDTILGFQPGDRLDLSAIDANGGAAGRQAFTLANGSSFTGPAQLVISHETREDGDYTVVSGNTTGPDAAEFKISLKGNHDLKASDFVLS